MKSCAYCGRENPDEAVRCQECGTDEFKSPAPPDPLPPEPAEEVTTPEPPANEPRPQVCPRCGMEYDGQAAKCFVDGSKLVPLGQPGRFEPTNAEWKRQRARQHRRIDFFTWMLGSAAFACLFYGVDRLIHPDSPTVSPVSEQVWPLFVAGIILALLARVARRSELKRRQKREDELPRDGSMPFVLLLRPFGSEQNLQVKNPDRVGALPGTREWRIPLSQLLSETFLTGPQLQVIGGDVIGPGRVRSPDETWQEEFHRRTRAALGIIVVPLPGKEVAWEIEELRKQGWLEKTIFLLPDPTLSREVQQRQMRAEGAKTGQPGANPNPESSPHEAFLDELRFKGFQLPRHEAHTLMVSLDRDGRLTSCETIEELSHQAIRAALQKRWGLLPGWSI